MSQMTYGHLRKKVLDCLFEHEAQSGETVLLDNARSAAVSRMPDVVSSCLVRMFETLSVGRKKAHFEFVLSEKAGFVKAPLPDDFSRFDSENPALRNAAVFYTDSTSVYFADSLFSEGESAELFYRALPPEITPETDEGFIIELSPLAFEALICLCALELCKSEDNSLYTRLYYKYSDLCMGLGEPLPSARRNSFFAKDTGKRWAK